MKNSGTVYRLRRPDHSQHLLEASVDGSKKLHTYPLCETKGLGFVFVGDTDYPPPRLVNDVPTIFLDDDRGWLQAQLYGPDGNIIAWRKRASARARGIQRPGHVDPPLPVKQA